MDNQHGGIRGVVGSGLSGTGCLGERCSVAPGAVFAGRLPALLPARCRQRRAALARAGTGERRLPKWQWQDMVDKRTSLPLDIETMSGRMGFREML